METALKTRWRSEAERRTRRTSSPGLSRIRTGRQRNGAPCTALELRLGSHPDCDWSGDWRGGGTLVLGTNQCCREEEEGEGGKNKHF